MRENDRTHVITLLSAASNEGLLPAGERDRRIGLARQAATFDDLVPLTRDLVDLVDLDSGYSWNTLPPSNLEPAAASQVAGTENSSDQLVAIFSGASRRGRWKVSRNISLLAAFGGVELDFSSAVFTSQTVNINAFCLFGGAEILIPPGVEVQNSMVSLFGATDSTKLQPSYPDAPVIVLHGLNLFGGTHVAHPKKKKKKF